MIAGTNIDTNMKGCQGVWDLPWLGALLISRVHLLGWGLRRWRLEGLFDEKHGGGNWQLFQQGTRN